VVERLVEKSTVGIVYPMPTCSNYMEWSAMMHVNLQAAKLWEAIRHGSVEYHDDRLMLVTLLHIMPVEMQAGLANKETTHKAWEFISWICVSVDQVKEANVERLHQEFTEIKFKLEEGVEDFSLCIMALVNKL
jgi:hypothetical protein